MENVSLFDFEPDGEGGELDRPATDSSSPFDAIRREDGRGEHWTGRDLQPLMDYGQWARFEAVIKKAKNSLALVQGQAAADAAFVQVSQVAHAGNLGEQGRRDYRLTRFGAYLTAIAGDDTKDAVAHARVYFAVRTRQAEIAEQSAHKKEEIPTHPEALRGWANAIEAKEAAERRAKIEAAGRKAAEEEIAALEGPAAQAHHHRAADGHMTVGDLANKLKAWAKDECNAKVLHDDVWEFCRELGLLMKSRNTVRKNRVTSFALDNGYMREKDSEHEGKDGRVYTNHTPRVTPKGEGYIWDRATRRIADTGTLQKQPKGSTK